MVSISLVRRNLNVVEQRYWGVLWDPTPPLDPRGLAGSLGILSRAQWEIPMNDVAGRSRQNPRKREPWTRTDKISRVSAVVAVIAFIFAVVPTVVNLIHDYFFSPRASITSVRNGEQLPSNRIAVSGTSRNISAGSDLWLTASGPSDQVYPIAELPTNTQWNATEKQVCFLIGPGTQRLDVWITPDTSDGSFVGFMQVKNHMSGFDSVPTGFVKAAQVTVHIQKWMSRC
jgi:hypothetical protein